MMVKANIFVDFLIIIICDFCKGESDEDEQEVPSKEEDVVETECELSPDS
jgi:hypothetical protein